MITKYVVLSHPELLDKLQAAEKEIVRLEKVTDAYQDYLGNVVIRLEKVIDAYQDYLGKIETMDRRNET